MATASAPTSTRRGAKGSRARHRHGETTHRAGVRAHAVAAQRRHRHRRMPRQLHQDEERDEAAEEEATEEGRAGGELGEAGGRGAGKGHLVRTRQQALLDERGGESGQRQGHDLRRRPPAPVAQPEIGRQQRERGEEEEQERSAPETDEEQVQRRARPAAEAPVHEKGRQAPLVRHAQEPAEDAQRRQERERTRRQSSPFPPHHAPQGTGLRRFRQPGFASELTSE